jgi:predicted DNA binding protein
MSQKYDNNGVAIWKVLVRSRTDLKKSVKQIRLGGIPVSVVDVKPAVSNNGLTRRQRRLLEMAYQKGFFDVPRRTTLRLLATELGVSPSTLMESLRRAEARILHDRFSSAIPPGYIPK